MATCGLHEGARRCDQCPLSRNQSPHGRRLQGVSDVISSFAVLLSNDVTISFYKEYECLGRYKVISTWRDVDRVGQTLCGKNRVRP
jgi:hypothetical protein